MMFFAKLSFVLSLTNWSAPIECLWKMFCWPGANKVILHDDIEQHENNPDHVPDTVEAMADLIEAIKSDADRAEKKDL